MEKLNEDFTNLYKRWKNGDVRKENQIKYIDLGLPSGTLWAEKNLGAETPYDYGDYYAWGETKTKERYLESTYKFQMNNKYIKYNKIDGLHKLIDDHDVIHITYNGKWHMPTLEQAKELIKNCTLSIKTANGGSLFYALLKSKINDNEIIFPFNGSKHAPITSSTTWLCEKPESTLLAYLMKFDTFRTAECSNKYRYSGCGVRGVMKKE